MARLYEKFKDEQPEAKCEPLDPKFRPLLEHALDLDARIEAAIKAEASSDPVKQLRYETAYEYLTSRNELFQRLEPSEVEQVTETFTKTPAGTRELALSGATVNIDSALFDLDICNLPYTAALSAANAANLYGVFTGIRAESRRRGASGGSRKHEANNRAKVTLLQHYLHNPEQFGSTKNEQAEKLYYAQLEILDSKKYLFAYETIRRWLRNPQTALDTALKNIGT
jgi:hypothetical protein